MGQIEMKAVADAESQPVVATDASGAGTVAPQQGSGATGGSCPTCGGSAQLSAAPSFVYAIGRIEARFPRLSVEKEFAQATGREKKKRQTDPHALQTNTHTRQNPSLVPPMYS